MISSLRRHRLTLLCALLLAGSSTASEVSRREFSGSFLSDLLQGDAAREALRGCHGNPGELPRLEDLKWEEDSCFYGRNPAHNGGGPRHPSNGVPHAREAILDRRQDDVFRMIGEVRTEVLRENGEIVFDDRGNSPRQVWRMRHAGHWPGGIPRPGQPGFPRFLAFWSTFRPDGNVDYVGERQALAWWDEEGLELADGLQKALFLRALSEDPATGSPSTRRAFARGADRLLDRELQFEADFRRLLGHDGWWTRRMDRRFYSVTQSNDHGATSGSILLNDPPTLRVLVEGARNPGIAARAAALHAAGRAEARDLIANLCAMAGGADCGDPSPPGVDAARVARWKRSVEDEQDSAAGGGPFGGASREGD